MNNYEEIARQYDEAQERGDDLENLKPVRARVARNAESIYSMRFTSEELATLSRAAEAQGERLSRFIRTAALERARAPSEEALPQILELLRAQNALLLEQNQILRERPHYMRSETTTHQVVTESWYDNVPPDAPQETASTNQLSSPFEDGWKTLWSLNFAVSKEENQAGPARRGRIRNG